MEGGERALTDAEWAEIASDPDYWDGTVTFLSCEMAEGLGERKRRPGALAALCLNGQPFGFTWEDVDAVRMAAARAGNEGFEDEERAAISAADRIAALLPPRP